MTPILRGLPASLWHVWLQGSFDDEADGGDDSHVATAVSAVDVEACSSESVRADSYFGKGGCKENGRGGAHMASRSGGCSGSTCQSVLDVGAAEYDAEEDFRRLQAQAKEVCGGII
jgi:hypothetical protein